MRSKVSLNNYVDTDCNLFNYDIVKILKLLNNFYAPPTQLPINYKNSKSAALGAIYQSQPPGFDCTSKTANAVSRSHLANADTGATGSYIATRDIESIQNVALCSESSQIHVQVANGEII